MKNKIILSLGLAAGVIAGASFADGNLPGTDLIDKNHSQSVSLKDLVAKNPTTGKYNYYDITCHIKNSQYAAEMNMYATRVSKEYSNWGENYLNEKLIPSGPQAAGTLAIGDNTLELKNVVFYDTSDAELKFYTNIQNYPGMGYLVNYCTYVLSALN